MNKEIKEKIELLKKKGLTIQEIKGILNLSNHDLYDKGDEPEQADPKTEVGPEAREKAKSNSSKGFETITISSNKAVNEFARQQERCLIKLINTIENPFESKWEWAEWHREAVALQLSQYKLFRNTYFIDNRVLWEQLLKESHSSREMRDFTVFLIHNFLTVAFSLAREELAYRERENENTI